MPNDEQMNADYLPTVITNEAAKKFVMEWIDAFNAHNLERILHHYADEITFYSPFIPLLKFNEEGVIRSKEELKMYFAAGLTAYPDLHFKLHRYFTGINSIVIYYTSVNGMLAAETFKLNRESKALEV